MATQAKLLSNHYDALGLSPKASQDEIATAFAAALSKLAAQPMVAKLHLYEAFGILRQPEKRKAYDRSIGLVAEPVQTTFVVPSRGAFSFAVAAKQTEVEQRPNDVEAVELLQPPVAVSEPVEAAEREPSQAPAAARDPDEDELHQLVERIRADGRAEKAALQHSRRQPQDWRRLGIAAGALIVGAGLVGGIAGVSATGPSSPEEDASVSTSLPTPSAYLKGSAPSRDFDAEAEAQVRAENEAAARRVAALDRKVDRLIIPPELQAETPKPAALVANAKPEPAATATAAAVDPLAPEPETPPAVAARMPLPNATIARTIEKIGYPCGNVSSIAPVDAGGGVFKVSCSSGHASRAAPTAGRYRFKKWSGA